MSTMHSITAKSVSLTFPLYDGRAARRAGAGAIQSDDDRLVVGPKGEILGVRALQDVSLALKSGDRLGVVGKNGSGKTTLLQVLAGIFPPDSGEVVIEGHATNLINLNLGMRSEATGHRNITLKGLAAGHSKDEIEARRSAIEEFAELGRFIEMPVETYSAGMRMRLSFAIATAFKPEILILDEWISAGDEAFRKKASKRMQDYVAQAGVLILASHSKNLLLDNCSAGIWLDRGRIRASGDIKDVLTEYETKSAPAA